jgi:hypothetical protein
MLNSSNRLSAICCERQRQIAVVGRHVKGAEHVRIALHDDLRLQNGHTTTGRVLG